MLLLLLLLLSREWRWECGVARILDIRHTCRSSPRHALAARVTNRLPGRLCSLFAVPPRACAFLVVLAQLAGRQDVLALALSTGQQLLQDRLGSHHGHLLHE
jgi:hypothetical protein